MVIGMGWVVFAGYCAGQSLQAAILLKDPEHQPAVETLDKVIRNLDTLDDIALVKLPTREVLRRYHVQKKELSAQRSATTTAGNLAESGQHSQKGLRRENSDRKHSASKEVRALLAAEALKAAVPTKEMEVMEWEQALFRAAKRAVARSKMPTARTLKLVKTLQRSSRLNFGTYTVTFLCFCVYVFSPVFLLACLHFTSYITLLIVACSLNCTYCAFTTQQVTKSLG